MHQRNEAQTRRDLIDPRLRDAGWGIVPVGPLQPSHYSDAAVEEWPTEAGPADYALCADGEMVGIVEAKKEGVSVVETLTQAERYSRGAACAEGDFPNGLRVPFLYSTNGHTVRFRDARAPQARARTLAGFHTPAALRERLDRDTEAELVALRALPFNERVRPYQREAITAVEEAVQQHKRNLLVAMATGTGKTLTTVSLVHRMMTSGAARRVLFLVDRRALAAQAVRAFASYEAEPGRKFDQLYEVYSQRMSAGDIEEGGFNPKVLPASYLTDPKPGDAFVYVCTIQRMTMNLFGREAVFTGEETEDDADQLPIPIHAFDLIVADECHRGYTSSEAGLWRQTLDHFDAVRVGLTATPAAHTLAYFDTLAYRYEYERAVREGYLVDYDVVNVSSEVRLKGVFLSEGDLVGVVDQQTGLESYDHLEDERQFEAGAVESHVTSPDSNRKILEEVKRYADAHEAETGRFPKTLVFAANDLPHVSHADNLAEIARDVFGRGDGFVRKITGRVDRPLQRIREFRNQEQPGIVITVDLLSTGVDIPDLEYIVFLRPVKSRILFEQMMGRGTRKGERHPDKSHFTVFDCFGGTLMERFRGAASITAEPPEGETVSIAEIVRRIYDNDDRAYNVTRLAKRLQRVDRSMSGEARDLFARYVEDGDLARLAREMPGRIQSNFGGTMKLLRDPDFQKLLADYPRPKRTFIIAYPVADEVSSEHLIRDGGREYRPGDYLTAFERFVRENTARVDALRILLEQPEGWSRAELRALRQTLHEGGFSEANLRRALRLAGLTDGEDPDLLSIVHHAADDSRPLLTPEVRARLASDRAAARRTLTPEQARWLGYLTDDLRENLSVDEGDFSVLPVLADRGGLGRARKAFGADELSALLRDLNAGMAGAAGTGATPTPPPDSAG